VKAGKAESMAIWLGLLGLAPFALLALSVWSPPWRSLALPALLAYSALILSFLGGVRWGRALEAGSPAQFVLAVLPSLYALGVLQAPPVAGLILLAAGFVGQWWLDVPADRMRAPAWFRRLRGWLTAGVLACHLLALGPLLPV
jgi:hypothetical protein